MTEPGGISGHSLTLMSAPLFRLRLYSDVKITRDYSVVQDMTPSDWADYLHTNGTELFDEDVNYYRLPRTIRIEGNYDTLRKVTYGYLLQRMNPPQATVTMERPQFFWVDAVRLITSTVRIDQSGTPYVAMDVVELDITTDVWSSNNGSFTLHDSFVVRRHMPRWTASDPDDPDTYKPRYYPNAADDVGGAYSKESVTDLTPAVEVNGVDYDIRYIVVNVIDSNGKQVFYIGCEAITGLGSNPVMHNIYATPTTVRYFTLQDVLNGYFYGKLGSSFSVSYIQSVTVVPYLGGLSDILTYQSGGLMFDQTDVRFSTYFTGGSDGDLAWLTLTGNDTGKMNGSMFAPDYITINPTAPAWVAITGLTALNADTREPMMYRAPARLRKVVSGMGGTIIDVPDIDAFEDDWTVQNMFEVSNAFTLVFGGTDIEAANAKGNLGSAVAPSLPIYESAWKTYEAIQKTGDDIAYNAQQTATIIGTLTGTGAGAVGGAIAGASGGAAGAAAGAVGGSVGGLVQGAVRYWSNSENLRAKRETIRNNPCTMVNKGSGLGAAVKDYVDIHYMVLVLDSFTLKKLRYQYYFYGYNVNEVVPGTLDLSTRHYFDYIETRQANVSGDLSADEASQIAAIFDRGVRIYHGNTGYAEIGRGEASLLENYEDGFA